MELVYIFIDKKRKKHKLTAICILILPLIIILEFILLAGSLSFAKYSIIFISIFFFIVLIFRSLKYSAIGNSAIYHIENMNLYRGRLYTVYHHKYYPGNEYHDRGRRQFYYFNVLFLAESDEDIDNYRRSAQHTPRCFIPKLKMGMKKNEVYVDCNNSIMYLHPATYFSMNIYNIYHHSCGKY